MRQLQPLRPYFDIQLGHARDIAARSAQAGGYRKLTTGTNPKNL